MNIGLLPHFVPLMFQQDANVQFRYVQSGGGAVRLKSLLGGHTDTSIFASSEFVLYKDQGIRPLVMFSESRIADLPDVPTAREIGVNTVFEERVMAFAPKHTPKDRIAVLAKALEASLNDAEVVERLKGARRRAAVHSRRSARRHPRRPQRCDHARWRRGQEGAGR
jgi:tripartite-type tricarboxylate transporter receptor subunit TctC